MANCMLLAIFSVAAAMQSSTAIEQISSPAGPDASDWSKQEVSRDVSRPSAPQPGEADQLDGEYRAPPEATQLTTEQSGGEVDQLGQRDRSTKSAPDLSERKQGFETRVVKLEGTDKCSAELLSAPDREYCQRAIENRSAEYAGTRQIELTPEQKLLGERNYKLIEGGTEGAIKRLTSGRNTAEDRDNQELASIVLGSDGVVAQPAQDQPAASDLSAETQALIDAIVKNVSGNPGG
jgi:hypothetical protein